MLHYNEKRNKTQNKITEQSKLELYTA